MVAIYKITSPSGKVYIGQSWNVEKRWFNYKNYKCKLQTKLYNSFKKYKAGNHLFEVIQELPCDVEQHVLDNYEIFYWEQYKSLGVNMLNIKVPGLGGKGSKHRPETIELMRQRQLENHRNPNRKKNHHYKPIVQYSKEGVHIRDWPSIKEAAETLGINKATVSNALKRNHTGAGFKWEYKNTK